jgi:hypothetical protein
MSAPEEKTLIANAAAAPTFRQPDLRPDLVDQRLSVIEVRQVQKLWSYTAEDLPGGGEHLVSRVGNA